MNKPKRIYLCLKRITDFLLALILLVMCLPVIFLFSIIIIFETREFPFFMQKRSLVLRSDPIYIFKLRTLNHKFKKEKKSIDIFNKYELNNYLSPFGTWLRNSGLDELPQLINVITGNMSLVGPRPFSLSDLAFIKKNMPEFYSRRCKINSKPGLTGLWQIYGNRALGIENLVELEEYYDKNRSFLYDLKIILATIPFCISGKNLVLNTEFYPNISKKAS